VFAWSYLGEKGRSASEEDLQNLIFLNVINLLVLQKKLIIASVIEIDIISVKAIMD